MLKKDNPQYLTPSIILSRSLRYTNERVCVRVCVCVCV